MQVLYDPGGIRLIDPWESVSEIQSIKGTRAFCKLSLTRCLYDPGTLPSSANQCVLGNVYLRTNIIMETDSVCGSTLPYSLPGLGHAANKVADRNDDT